MTIQVKQISTLVSLPNLASKLLDDSAAIGSRFLALFQLKALGSAEALNVMEKALATESILLRHEIYYCLGQMQVPEALEILLRYSENNAMAEHEQMEALGCYPITSEIKSKLESGLLKSRIVKETCELALKNLEAKKDVQFNSIDPSPASSVTDLQELEATLMDTGLCLFDRYKAMFALRNINSDQAVEILANGFKDDSALFRHEIAFVFGQMRQLSSIPALISRVVDLEESSIVRHECVEALGSIGTDECVKVLKKYLSDNNRVVRESCEVGLDMIRFEQSETFITVQEG